MTERPIKWEGLPIFRCKSEPHPEHAWFAADGQVYVCDRGTTPGRVSSRSTWLCHVFGHRYQARGAFRVDGGGWLTRQITVPLVTYCKRCGGAPEPEQGLCAETIDGMLGGKPMICGQVYGHRGQHRDASTGATWTPPTKETA